MTKQTHHVYTVTVKSCDGTHQLRERLHKSRVCSNCSADGTKDPEWSADDGVKQFGRCMNGIGSDLVGATVSWCGEHSTPFEHKHGLRRPLTPALTLVTGGAV